MPIKEASLSDFLPERCILLGCLGCNLARAWCHQSCSRQSLAKRLECWSQSDPKHQSDQGFESRPRLKHNKKKQERLVIEMH